MNAAKTTLRQTFGIGTRTEIRLDEHSLLTLSVRAGDLLRNDGGTVWATIDGELEDILLGPGDVYAVPRDREIHVSGFEHVRLEIYGHGPLQYEVARLQPASRGTSSIWQALVGTMRAAIGSVKAPAIPA